MKQSFAWIILLDSPDQFLDRPGSACPATLNLMKSQIHCYSLIMRISPFFQQHKIMIYAWSDCSLPAVHTCHRRSMFVPMAFSATRYIGQSSWSVMFLWVSGALKTFLLSVHNTSAHSSLEVFAINLGLQLTVTTVTPAVNQDEGCLQCSDFQVGYTVGLLTFMYPANNYFFLLENATRVYPFPYLRRKPLKFSNFH